MPRRKVKQNNFNVPARGVLGRGEMPVLKSVVPHQVPEYLVKNKTTHGVEGVREMKFLEFPFAPYTNTNPIMRLEFPRNGLYDFKRGYLKLTCNCVQTGGTYVRFSRLISCIFYQVKVLVGNEELVNQRSFNLKTAQFWEVGRIPGSGIDGTIGYSCYGVGSQAQRNAWAAGHTYYVPFDVGFFTAQPVNFSAISKPVVLEITLETPGRCLESDGGSLNYSVTDAELSTEILTEMAPEYMGAVMRMGGWHWVTNDYDEYISEITTNRRTIDIPHVGQSIHAITIIMRDQNTIADPTVDDRLTTWNYNDATSLQFKVNNDFFPERPYNATGEATELYIELLKFLGHWDIAGLFTNPIAINAAQYVGGKFLMAIDFETHPYHEGALLNDFTLTHGNTWQALLALVGAPAQPQEIHIFVHYHKVFHLNAQGHLGFEK
jgi:hypothetical protein